MTGWSPSTHKKECRHLEQWLNEWRAIPRRQKAPLSSLVSGGVASVGGNGQGPKGSRPDIVIGRKLGPDDTKRGVVKDGHKVVRLGFANQKLKTFWKGAGESRGSCKEAVISRPRTALNLE